MVYLQILAHSITWWQSSSTLHYCFPIGCGRVCYGELDKLVTPGSLKRLKGLTHWETWEACLNTLLCPLKSGMSSEDGCDSTWPGHTESGQAPWKPGRWQSPAWGQETFKELNFYCAFQSFIALYLNCLAKKRIFWSCMTSDALLVLVMSLSLTDCTAPWLGWEGSSSGLFGEGSYFLVFKVGIQTTHSQC